MSLTLTGPISFETANNTLILNNQAACTVGFKLLIPSVGLASGVQQDLVMRFPGDGFYSYFIPDSNGTTVQFTTRWYIVGGSSSKTVTLNVGQAYWIVSTHTSGGQTVYITGVPSVMGALTNPTVNFNTWFGIGYPTAGTTSQATIDELFFINGYCAVQQDVLDLVFGSTTPALIGANGTAFGEWDFAGNVGTSPAIGNAALKCSDGVHTITTISVGSGGSALYSAPLTVFNNTSIQIDPRSATVVGGTAGEIFDPRNTRIVK